MATQGDKRKSPTPKRWVSLGEKTKETEELSQKTGLSPVTAQVLMNRGLLDPDGISRFMEPSLLELFNPFRLQDMEKATHRLYEATCSREKIVIYGDYDVDGTTSTAMLVSFFRKLGAFVDYYIPDRRQEGYSLNEKALFRLKEQGCSILITVDNGIRAHHEAKIASKLGIDLIITDHHETGETLPEAFAVINPKRHLEGPGQELAGVGVAFFLLMALRKKLRDENFFSDKVEPNLKEYLDLVTLGTIADLCPLRGANRVFAKLGLPQIEASKRKGMRALLKVSGIQGEVSAGQVGFHLGPRINAAGRLQHANLGVELLLTEDDELADKLAGQLDLENSKRKAIEEEMVQDVLKKIEEQELVKDRRSIVVYDPSYHGGVIGIVASRIVERFHYPCIVLTEEGCFLKGSARSIAKLNMVEALSACGVHLEKFGGHFYAAGMTLKEENLQAFYDAFDLYVRSHLSEEDFLPLLKIDAEVTLEEVSWRLLEEFQKLAPFGMGNPEPLLSMKDVVLKGVKIVGGKHLKGRVETQGRRADFIGFQLGEALEHVTNCNQIIFSPGVNAYQGMNQIQFVLRDFKSQ